MADSETVIWYLFWVLTSVIYCVHLTRKNMRDDVLSGVTPAGAAWVTGVCGGAFIGCVLTVVLGTGRVLLLRGFDLLF